MNLKECRLFVLLLVCWLATTNHLSAQSCTSLPHGPRELWLAAGVFNQGVTRWDELAVEASTGNGFGVSLRRVTGGSERDSGLEAFAVRVGVPFKVRWAGFCVFGGFELNDFSFVDRYEVDRGDANYLAREMGIRADVPIAKLGGAEVRAWIAPAVSSLKWEVAGRTLIVEDEIYTEERNLGGTQWEFSGQAGLTLRWGPLGISGGVANRPALVSGAMAFVTVGIAVIRGGETSSDSIHR